jgi:hypothetical protein
VNTLIWDDSASAVNSPVVDYTLSDCNSDSEPLFKRRRRAANQVSARMELNSRTFDPPTLITGNYSDEKLVYNFINATQSGSGIAIAVYPVDPKVILDVYVNVNVRSNRSVYLWHQTFAYSNWSVPSNSSNSSDVIFIGAQNMTNISSIYIGVSDQGNNAFRLYEVCCCYLYHEHCAV